ncbi:hypothetical protein QFZ72_004340 [Bacillus sp. V2I10]|nr:hypothetical protein [Bacillus sp. V2I10]
MTTDFRLLDKFLFSVDRVKRTFLERVLLYLEGKSFQRAELTLIKEDEK